MRTQDAYIPLSIRGICGGYSEEPQGSHEYLKNDLIAQFTTFLTDDVLSVCAERDNRDVLVNVIKMECERMMRMWHIQQTLWDEWAAIRDTSNRADANAVLDKILRTVTIRS